MKQGINLIPSSILAARARRVRLRFWITINAALGIAAASFLFVARPQTNGLVDRLEAEHEDARSQLASAQEQLAHHAQMLREARTNLAVARRIGARPDFSGLLQTVARELDPRASLDLLMIAPLAADQPDPRGPEAIAQAAAAQAAAVLAAVTGAAPQPATPAAAPKPARDRYEVMLSGIATTAGVASEFVLRLDQTGYFSNVRLVSTSGRDIDELRAVEFQITGTLGDSSLAAAGDKP